MCEQFVLIFRAKKNYFYFSSFYPKSKFFKIISEWRCFLKILKSKFRFFSYGHNFFSVVSILPNLDLLSLIFGFSKLEFWCNFKKSKFWLSVFCLRLWFVFLLVFIVFFRAFNASGGTNSSCPSKLDETNISLMVDNMEISDRFQLGIAIGCQPKNDSKRAEAAITGIIEVLSIVF